MSETHHNEAFVHCLTKKACQRLEHLSHCGIPYDNEALSLCAPCKVGRIEDVQFRCMRLKGLPEFLQSIAVVRATCDAGKLSPVAYKALLTKSAAWSQKPQQALTRLASAVPTYFHVSLRQYGKNPDRDWYLQS